MEFEIIFRLINHGLVNVSTNLDKEPVFFATSEDRIDRYRNQCQAP
jgi:hypothetical protein